MTAPARRGPGLGDRWIAGEALPGVAFALHDRVRATAGAHAGRAGRVVLLAAAPPGVAYVVEFADGVGPARVAQEDLAAA